MSIWLIMVFPLLFAAGMALIDTTDGVLMLGAYNWAFVKPARKLQYNLVITAVSVAVASVVGVIQVLGSVGGRLGRQGGFWDAISGLNDHFNEIGFAIVGMFILAWIVFVDDVPVRSRRRVGADHQPAPRPTSKLCKAELKYLARQMIAVLSTPHRSRCGNKPTLPS